MKNLIKNLGIFVFILLGIFQATAQDIQRSAFPPRQAGWWTIGINGGWAYQQSDVATTLDGYGFGMTLAKNFYYRPGGAISFDWRGRWLYSQTIGLDTKRSFGIEHNSALNGTRSAGEGLDYTTPNGPGYVFQNYKTHQFELGLEGVLTANRLRERTGIIASIYGGVNLDWYNPLLDQSNNNGIYDYSSIDHMNDSRSNIKSILRNNILDGTYETNAHGFEDGTGKIKFMPSLGLELGYQFTPRFSMHVGHKATFARTDDLDGQLWKNDNNVTADNDIHHYTNLALRWIIEPRTHTMEPPIINVTRPSTNPYVSRTSHGAIDAKIKNVRSAADITCSVNGYPTSFSFNRGKFRVNFPLEYGENQIVITATNEVGTDEATIIIHYGDNSPPPVTNNSYAPKIRITNPRNTPYTSDNQSFTVKANIKYVHNKNDIEFLVNGRNVYDFNYNNRNDNFSGRINLNQGRNEIEVIGRNEVGSDRDHVVIFYDKKTETPEVRITSPARTPHETTQINFTVKAKLKNVNSKNDVRFFVNGREKSLFNYNVRNGKFSADLTLVNGRNEVVVKGYNDAGNAQDEATIILKKNTPTAQYPTVDITNPSRNNYETSIRDFTVRANLQYVGSKNDVRFFVNGKEKGSFNYNARNGKFSANITLVNGRNEVVVKGYNNDGNAQDEATIIFKNNTPTVQPPQVTITSVSMGTTNPFDPNPNSCQTTIVATILNITQKNKITFRVNNRKRNDFSFNANTHQFKITLALDEGSNHFLVRAVNSAGSDEDTASKNCTIQTTANPPKVTINNPKNNSTSTKNTVNLNARIKNVTRKNDIRVKLNGSTISSFSFSPVSGVVTAQLNLKNGNNTISVFGKNNDGTDEKSVKVKYNAPNNPPTVDITTPNANTTTDTKTATIKAKILNVSGKNDIRFTFNGNNFNNFTYSTSSKKLSANVTLKEGNNTITIKATTSDGSDSETVRITYHAPKVLPTVRITSPHNNTSTENKTTTVKATVKNVTGKNNVTFLVNGKSTNSFSLSGNTIKATVSLKEGSNTIRIQVKNNDGNDSDQVKIKYRPKVIVQKPTVVFTNPRKPGKNAKGKKTTAKATVKNITKKSQINVLFNGSKISFSFSTRKNEVSIPLILKAGNNTISITATNEGGTASAQTSLIFNHKPVPSMQKPKITITSASVPTTNPFNPNVSGSTIIGTIQNISDKSQISITHNGKAIKDFSFNPRSKKFQVAIQLTPNATNKVKITAQNRAGKDTKTHTY
ncbi:MAG TPA: hypothetical protein ENJ53_00620 [Phaeodactylibacter sp.]|nr:hypothetical protein [Phaeodactylibacter sp.]